MATCAVLGPEGTFTEEAASKYLNHETKLVYTNCIGDVFELVTGGKVDGGLVPLWNTQAGSIPATIKNLINRELIIDGEITLPVRHYLMGREEHPLGTIEVVISQPAVFLQCEQFISSYLPGARKEIVDSTSTAASFLTSEKRIAAAIGPKTVASVYGLHILAERVEDDPKNCTTFIHISPKFHCGQKPNKTSVVFGLPDKPGALYEALGVFARRGINLSRLESRPRSQGADTYLFFIDLEGGIHEEDIKKALQELEDFSVFYKFLGSYPKNKS
ncbi:MAG: prephenate dehydratase [Chitinophagales bacterium]